MPRTLTTDERSELERLRAADRTRRAADLVSRAANDFHDPDDAIAMLDRAGHLAYIETAAEAKHAVQALAELRPHLVRSQPAAPAALRRAPEVLTLEELEALDARQLAALKLRNPDLYERSVNVSLLGLAPDGRHQP